MTGLKEESYDEVNEIEELIGKTFRYVTLLRQFGAYGAPYDALIFELNDRTGWVFHHTMDCCEDVSIEDMEGDLADLVGVPILQATESIRGGWDEEYGHETWTFYRFGTIKGYVTVRWYGESNGFYSERVDLSRLEEWREERWVKSLL